MTSVILTSFHNEWMSAPEGVVLDMIDLGKNFIRVENQGDIENAFPYGTTYQKDTIYTLPGYFIFDHEKDCSLMRSADFECDCNRVAIYHPAEEKQETADKEKQYLFPKASDEAKKAGWTHSTAFMDDIQNYVDDHGESISPEAIEYVLEYLEATHVESTPSDQEELLTELWELAQHKFNCQQFLKEAKEKYRIERNS